MKQETNLEKQLQLLDVNDVTKLNKYTDCDIFDKIIYGSCEEARRARSYYSFTNSHEEFGINFSEDSDTIELFRRYLHYALYVSKIKINDNIVTFDAMIYDDKDVFYNVLIYDKSNKNITYSDEFVQYIFDTNCEMKNDDIIDLNKYDFISKVITKEDVVSILNKYHKYTNCLCLYFIYRDSTIKLFNN